MIKHTVKTRHNHYTFHFLKPETFEKAIDNPHGDKSVNMLQMAHTVYDHITRRFVKHREGEVELLNALLIVERRRHSTDTEIFDLVREHA